jgi:hypothetical protein
MRKDSAAGRVLGIVIFVIGVGILVLVAVIAYGLFTASTPALHATPGAPSGAAAELGKSALGMLYRIALLVVLCIAGSLLAARGLHLYFVATGSAPRGGGHE